MGSQVSQPDENSMPEPGQRPRQCSILNRTLAVLGGYSIFLIGTLAGAVYYVNSSLQQAHQSVLEFDQIYDDVARIQDLFLYQAKDRKNLFLRGDNPSDFETYSNRIQNNTETIKNQIEIILSNPLIKPYQAEINRFSNEHQQLVEIYRQGIVIMQTTQSLAAGDAHVRGKGWAVGDTLAHLLDRIKRDRATLIEEKEQQIQTFLLFSTTGFSLFILTGSGILIGVVTRPMRRIMRFTKFLEKNILAQVSSKNPLLLQTASSDSPRNSPNKYRQVSQDFDYTYHPAEGKQPDEIGYMVETYSKLAQRIGTSNQQLQARDSLLFCVNAATQALVATEDLATALNTMLKILGQGTGQCRAYILQLCRDEPTAELCFDLTYEWDAPKIQPKRETGGRFPVPIKVFPDHLTAPLKLGQATQFLARDLDGIAPQDRQPGQALSLVGVPITVDGEWWGVLGLDDCRVEWQWSEAEIAVLETAATALGSAVERDRHRQAREVAERKALMERERMERADALEVANQVLSTRDRWLQTAATAAKQLLSNSDVATGVNLALQTLGENLDCDRLGVMRHLSAQDSLGQFQLLYEWTAPNAIRQLTDSELVIMPASDFQDWTLQLMAGQSVGGSVAVLKDSFRRKLELLGTLCCYAVPLFMGAKFWGLMFIDYCQTARQLSPPELAVLRTAATCVGSAIEQEAIRQDKALQERTQLLSTVAEVANLLLKSPDYTTVLSQVVQLLGEVVPGDRCGIAEVVSDLQSGQAGIKIRPVWEWRSPSTPPITGFTPQQTPFFTWEELPYIAAAMRQGKPASSLVVDLPPCDRRVLESQKITAILCVPITVEGQLWGFIHFDNCSQSRAYDDAEIAILQVAAESIAAAIARQNQELALRNAERAILTEKEQAVLQRTRLAHEIHDTLAQTFSGISLQLETARSLTSPEAIPAVSLQADHPTAQNSNSSDPPNLTQAHNAILQARDLAREGLAEARRSVRAFRSDVSSIDSPAPPNHAPSHAPSPAPMLSANSSVEDRSKSLPEENGQGNSLNNSLRTLPNAICKALAQVDPETGLSTHFYLEGDPCSLPRDLQLDLLCIAQEAIANTQRHAEASQLDITLSYETAEVYPQQIRLRIVDDGQGFDTAHLLEQSGLGLIGIRERAARFYGSFELQSSPTIGTTLDIVIPL